MNESMLEENFNDLCRICASKSNLTVRINIFQNENNDKQIYNRINSCLPIQVFETDELPKIICTECYCKLDLCFTFRNKSLETEQLLLKFINRRKEQQKRKIDETAPQNVTEQSSSINKSKMILYDWNKSNKKHKPVHHQVMNMDLEECLNIGNKTQQTNVSDGESDVDFNSMLEMVNSGGEDENDCESKEREFIPLNPIKTEPIETENAMQFYCDMCNQVFFNRDNYVVHYEEHFSKCLACEMLFPNNDDLQVHRTEMHSSQKKKSLKSDNNESYEEDVDSECIEEDEDDLDEENGSKMRRHNMFFQNKTQPTGSEGIYISPEVYEAANSEIPNIIPEKSCRQYERAYTDFKEWCEKNNVKIISENVLLAYLEEKSKKLKCSSLWSIHSMLKTMIYLKEKINIKTFPKLLPYLKNKSVGYQAKKSMTLTKEQIDKFIREAPDVIYLMKKIVLIMGVCGSCKRDELINITIDDIEDKDSILIIKISDSKSHTQRTFIITNLRYIQLYRKYSALRPAHSTTRRLFLKYMNGKCVNQVVGTNKIGAIPSEIAMYLELPNPEQYTGHCYRRTSANLLKQYKGFASSTFTE